MGVKILKLYQVSDKSQEDLKRLGEGGQTFSKRLISYKNFTILFGVRIRHKFNYDTSLVLIIMQAYMNCVLLSCVTNDLQNSFGKKKPHQYDVASLQIHWSLIIDVTSLFVIRRNGADAPEISACKTRCFVLDIWLPLLLPQLLPHNPPPPNYSLLPESRQNLFFLR